MLLFSRAARLSAVLLLTVACAPGTPPTTNPASGHATTTILVIRHAEQVENAGDDPPLRDTGPARARSLVEVAETAGVDVIYATEFQRTKQTAQPLADHLNIPVRQFDVNPPNLQAYASALAEEIRSEHAGQTVLVVSHRPTVPMIIQALTGEAVPAPEEREYDRLYVVVLPTGGEPQIIRTRYGPPSVP